MHLTILRHLGLSFVLASAIVCADEPKPLETIHQEVQPEYVSPTSTPVAIVIESFVSQGCSSCPPSEEVLAGIEKEQADAGTPIAVVSYHVDYWDYLGWADPHATSDASDHQRNMAAVVKLERLYTPQAIVNGRHDVVASDRGQLMAAIENERKTPSPTKLEISFTNAPSTEPGSMISVSYRTEGDVPSRSFIYFALTFDNAVTEVKAGENAGKTLTEHNVVRWYQGHEHDEIVKLMAADYAPKVLSFSLRVPDDLTEEMKRGARVVGYLISGQGIHAGAYLDVPYTPPKKAVAE